MKLIAFLALSLCTLIPMGKSGAHEFHLSKCIIDYAAEQQSFQIMLHVFLDDFEVALAETGAKNLKLCSEKEAANADELIYAYLQERLFLNINDQEVSYNYIGKENSEDLIAVWIYLEIEDVLNIQNIEVNNSILTEVFDDQQNLVQIKGPNGKRGMMMLNKDKTSEAVKF